MHCPESGREEKTVLIFERERQGPERTIQGAVEQELFRALRRQRKAKAEKPGYDQECAFHGENSPPKCPERQQNLWDTPPGDAWLILTQKAGSQREVIARRLMHLRGL